MPNDTEGPINVFDNSVSSINLALGQILERLDVALGLRGEPTIYAATTVGAPGVSVQAARLADLPSEQPSNPLYWIARPRIGGVWAAPTALTDGTGGTANDTLTAMGGITALTDSTGGAADNTLAALGGITALTDNSGGTANDTVEVIPAAAGDAGGLATVSLAANVATVASVDAIVAAVKNDVADLAAKVNALVADMNDARDNFADVSAKVNALIADMNDSRDNCADLAAKVNAIRTALVNAEVLY